LQVAAILFWQQRDFLTGGGFCAVFTGLVYFHFRRDRLKPFFIAFVLIAGSLAVQTWILKPLSPGVLPKTATYFARTVGLTTVRDGRSQVVVDLERRIAPAPEPVSGRVRLTIGDTCVLPQNADVVFSAAVKKPRSYKNPGVFDYRAFLARQNVWGQGFVRFCELVNVEKTRGTWWWQRFQQRLDSRFNRGGIKNGPILAALLLGTRSIGSAEGEIIRDFGLSHLFAISGMQFAVMSAIVFWLVGFATKLFPRLYLVWPRQKIASVATLGFIAAYLLVVLPQPSVIRAGLMIAAYLALTLAERQKNLLHVILLSMALVLLFRPTDLFDVSFQLSYLCVLSLAAVAPAFLNRLEAVPFFTQAPKPLRYAVELVTVSWLLNVLLIPLIAADFGSVSLNGLIHNVWGIPYFDFVVTPLSLVYLVASAVSFPLAEPVLRAWDASVTLFLNALHAASVWKLPNLVPFPPHTGHLLIFYGLVFAFFLTRRKSFLAALAIIMPLSLAVTYYETHLSFDARVVAIDVGQGDAQLIRTRDKTVLIDAGGSAFFDVGKTAVAPFLLHEWVGRIDAGIVTHADLDHFGGFKSLLDVFEFGEIWVNDRESKDRSYQELLAAARAKNVPIRIISGPEDVFLDDKTALKILSPGPETTELTDDNDHSIVVKLVRGNFSALFTGDISKRAERKLASAYGDALKSDVLKVAHHGSKTSTSPAFLSLVAPNFALIGVGENSQFGHPYPETLRTLEAAGTKIFRTDLNGAVRTDVRGTDVDVKGFVRP
jgi:competence protein ComEC